jgi:hypothetical protein
MGCRSAFACLAFVLLLSGCTGQPSGSHQQTSEPREAVSSGGSADDNKSEPEGKRARLLRSGFGQSGRYAWVTSLVENQAQDNVGQFVTVGFTLLDSDGEILAKADQVERFSRADEKLAVGTQVDIPDRGKVAKVKAATMEVGELPNVETEPFPKITTGKVKVVRSEYSEYGDRVGRVRVNNPTDESLKSPRVSLICLNAKDRVIGGGSAYPELVPPAGKVLAEVTLIASGKIKRCEAYAGPGL